MDRGRGGRGRGGAHGGGGGGGSGGHRGGGGDRGRGGHGGGGGGGRDGGGGYRGGGGQGGGGRDGGGGYRGGGGGGGHRGGPPGGRGHDRGGFHGGGGGFRGGGGGGRPQPKVTTSKATLPKPITLEMLQGQYGWKDRDIAIDNLKPPPCKGPGTEFERRIELIVNHIPATIKVPDLIYQYEIAIDLSSEDKKAKKNRKEKKDQQQPGPSRGRGGKEKRGSPVRGAGGRKGRGGSTPGASPGRDLDDLPIDPPKPKLWKKIVLHIVRRLEEEHQKLTRTPIKIATDGLKQMYTVRPIAMADNAAKSFEIRISLRELNDDSETSPDTYVVTIQQVDIIDTTSHDFQSYLSNIENWLLREHRNIPAQATKIDQIYNIVIKTLPMYRFIPVGRAAFYPEPRDDGFHLGGGLANWTGHSLIFNFGWKPFINIDVANSAFLLGKSVYEVLDDLFAGDGYQRGNRQSSNPRDGRSITHDDLKKAVNLLRTCKVKYTWNNGESFTKRVSDVVPQPAHTHNFTGPNGPTNVQEYCEREKRTRLEHPAGVCLKLGNAIVPAEVCHVVKGQAFGQKLAEAQTANMIKDTAKPPAKRLEKIQESLRISEFGKDAVLKEFGVNVADQLLRLKDARVLPRPTIVYKSETHGEQIHVLPGIDGVWSTFEGGMKFIKTANTSPDPIKWAVIEIGRYGTGDPLRNFLSEMIRTAAGVGLILDNVDNVLRENNGHIDPGRDMKDGLSGDLEYYQQNGYKFVLVVIPSKDTRIYSVVKQCAELFVKNGILTQCVVQKNVLPDRMKNRIRSDVVQNIILKLHAKLGGLNYLIHPRAGFESIDILRAPVMIVGADVTHPMAGSALPSMAAVTASIHRSGMPFLMHTQAQRKAESGAAEIIEGMEQIMFAFLHEYIKRTGYKPRKIIFYRDGVGSSQFAEVLQTEMMAIRAACARIARSPEILQRATGDHKFPQLAREIFEPKITFLAVQKRHRTRFFPAHPADGIGRPENAPPGTVVDNAIVSAANIDFYLLSHTGIQGTSRPTRYQVLWDDSDFSMDELEILSYYLCYMYCRCNRSVSYPAPTYYAHLAATRAKIHITGLDDEQLENITGVNEYIQRQRTLIDEFPMHFV